METHELEWLRRVRDLSQQLGSETDLARLTPRILDAAIELTCAERALLVDVSPPGPDGPARVAVLASRGFHQEGLAGAPGAVPRTACEQVLAEGRGLTTSRQRDHELLSRMTSVAALGVRSLAAVPLRVRGDTTGVLYLDHREQEGLFLERDLPTLQTLATQAALSLELLREREASAEPSGPSSGPCLVGSSAPIQALRDEVRRASRCREPVLVCGETGTELGWVARELHALGPDRANRLRLLIAGDDAQASRALFGSADQRGWLTEATTVAISEIEALGPDLQRLLVEALRAGSFLPPGSEARAQLRARVVGASHADLHRLMLQGAFRPDLFYRLDVLRLVVPALRQRSDDLPALCARLLQQIGADVELAESAHERLRQYAWPGNLLELESELRRVAGAQARKPVEGWDFSDRVRAGRGVVDSPASFAGKTLGEIEEDLVRKAMQECGGVKARAARQLGIPRSTLYHLLERFGISGPAKT